MTMILNTFAMALVLTAGCSLSYLGISYLSDHMIAGFLSFGAAALLYLVTEELLVEKKIVRRRSDGIRLLGVGELTAAVTLSLHGATKTARRPIRSTRSSVRR